jgi:hypothetical protein
MKAFEDMTDEELEVWAHQDFLNTDWEPLPPEKLTELQNLARSEQSQLQTKP